MEKIYTIGSNQQLSRLGFDWISLPNLKEDEIHDWVVRELSKIEFDKLIIDLSGDSVKAIQVAFHIRLSLNELSSKVLSPILFVSPNTLNKVMADSGIWSNIFATKGAFFITSYEKEKVSIEVSEIAGLKYDEYRRHFLDIINVQPDEKIGRHSLANQWGAYVMDKAANANSLATNAELKKAQNTLYFKFVAAHNFDYNRLNPRIKLPKQFGNIQFGIADTIPAQGKRILLIDDEADKGWEAVLRAVFKTTAQDDFQVISRKLKGFDSLTDDEKALIINGNFDLFLIDLRLNGIEEEALSNPNAFSGTKILKKIKELNKGNQVIMFTASNKAWNMKTLLDLGADGYYIKESPEYNFLLEFSKENYSNFKDEVFSSFKLSFLKQIYNIHAKCISYIDSDRNKRSFTFNKFYDRSLASLDIAFELLRKSAINEKYLSLAYLSYYHILEDYAAQQENFRYDQTSKDAFVNETSLVIEGDSKIWKLKFVEKGEEKFNYFKIGEEVNPKNWSALAKISFILAFKFGKQDQDLKKWGALNDIRNNKVGHGKNKGFVTQDEIFELLNIVELFLTNPYPFL